MLLNRVLRWPGVPLFFLLIGIYAYFYQAGGANQNTRFDLVRSIVEEQTFQINLYHNNTTDKAKRESHYYTDKAPGVSWLGVPVYEAIIILVGNKSQPPRYLDTSMYLATVAAIAIPSALGGVMLFVFAGMLGLSSRASVALSLAYGLGTLAFPYSTLFYGHQLAATLLLVAFVLLVRIRHQSASGTPTALALVTIGVLLGYAVVTEYPAALACAALGIYAAIFVQHYGRLVWLAVGMAIPGTALALYHNSAFGGPFTLPYEFSTQVHRHLGFFMGISLPDANTLYQILFSSYRGLFYSAPWLLLAIPGAILLLRQHRFRAEAMTCIAIVVVFVWLNASLVDWEGGAAMGPRYLIPAIPFLVILTIGAWEAFLRDPTITTEFPKNRISKMPAIFWLKLIALMLCFVAVGISMIGMLAGTAVNPQVSAGIKKPFEEVLYPLFFSGNLSMNFYPVDGPLDGRFSEWPGDAKFLSWAHGRLDFSSDTGSLISVVSHATNAGKLIGLEGLASLLPLAFYALAVGGWLRYACNQLDSDK